jgi:hypothetical protein
VRNLGNEGFCGAHLTELYRAFDPKVFMVNGVGIQAGPLRPDWGPSYSEVECVACGASWVGIVGEHCPWCAWSHHLLLAWQTELLLTPPDVADVDRRRPDALKAWAHRLATAVKAGIVDERAARRAWDREVRRDIAA